MATNRLLLAMIAATLLLSACVVAPVSRPYYGEAVIVAPPSHRVEYGGPPPVAGYVWIDGFWNWGGSRHEWVPGRWEAPRSGHYWVPHRWKRDGEHWRQHGGQWEPHGDRHDDHRGGHRGRD